MNLPELVTTGMHTGMHTGMRCDSAWPAGQPHACSRGHTLGTIRCPYPATTYAGRL